MVVKFRAVIPEEDHPILYNTFYFTLEDMVHMFSGIEPFVYGHHLLEPWLQAGGEPDIFTGQYDVMRKEIYTGDILSIRWREDEYSLKKVFFLNGAFRVTTFHVLDTDLARQSVVKGCITQGQNVAGGMK